MKLKYKPSYELQQQNCSCMRICEIMCDGCYTDPIDTLRWIGIGWLWGRWYSRSFIHIFERLIEESQHRYPIAPCMLKVHRHQSVLAHNDLERLIKPSKEVERSRLILKSEWRSNLKGNSFPFGTSSRSLLQELQHFIFVDIYSLQIGAACASKALYIKQKN